jgi:hypothetical protein
VTDAEILAYMKKNEKKFKAEDSWSRVCFNCRWSIKEDEAGVKERISGFCPVA